MQKRSIAAMAGSILMAAAGIGALFASGTIGGDPITADEAAAVMEAPAIEADAPGSVAGDILAEFTIELTVSEGQPPPIVTDITLWKLDGTAYVNFNSRFVWTDIPQYTEHIEPFVVANEGENDVTVTITVADAPDWAMIDVLPATALVPAGSSVDFAWTLTIDGEAPIGAAGFITISLVQG